MVGISLILAGAVALGVGPHSESNPVFGQLVSEGVSPDGEKFFPLPVPLMPDGLDKAAQRKIIAEIARPNSFEKFTEKNVLAPHVLKMPSVAGGEKKSPMKAVDIYFAAYGDMETMTKKGFLSDVFSEGKQVSDEGEAEGATLTAEQLAARGIVVSPEHAEHESYGQTKMQFINQVELSVVGHSFWSRTEDSIITAAMVDPRFIDDPEFPNIWRPLKRNDAGKLLPGAPQPYRGAGLYMKITRLAEPAGALFVEAHVIYHEPHGWFNGQNQLGAKIPAVTQKKVREMRQEMLRAAD
jgi:hypothetical protein